MRIKLKAPTSESKTFRLNLWLPTSIIKTKWIWNVASKKDSDSDVDYLKIRDMLVVGYKELKKYTRKYGHFTLLMVETKDNEKIEIRL